jgi:hypothetical protein
MLSVMIMWSKQQAAWQTADCGCSVAAGSTCCATGSVSEEVGRHQKGVSMTSNGTGEGYGRVVMAL